MGYITPSTATTYTVTGIDVNGCSASVTTVVTPQFCCLNGTGTPDLGDIGITNNIASAADIFPGGILNNAISALDASFATNPSTGILVANKSFSINGNFTVDANFVLKNCDIKMGPGAEIFVNPCAKLTISGCHIYGCSDLWNGISVAGQGGNSGPAFVSVENSIIEDAWNAITSTNGGSFKVIQTVFNRNFKGIKVYNYSGDWIEGNCMGQLAMVPHDVTGSVFTCRTITGIPNSGGVGGFVNSILTGVYAQSQYPHYNSLYSATNTGGQYQFTTLKNPVTNLRAYNGMEINIITNAIPFTLTNSNSPNTFDYLNYGVQTMVSNVEIYNNIFVNIYNDAAVTPANVTDCAGVWSFGYTYPPFYNLTVGGDPSVNPHFPNMFCECTNGVKSVANDNWINYNTFENHNITIDHNFGIEIYQNADLNNEVTYNTMSGMRYGIFIHSVTNVSTAIANNNIEVNAKMNVPSSTMTNFGIASFFNLLGSNLMYIRDNDINLDNIDINPTITHADGIRVGATSSTKRIDVIGNDIHLNNAHCDQNLKSDGIQLASTDNVIVSCNFIENAGTGATTQTNNLESNGVYAENSNNTTIANNSTLYMANGIGAAWNCQMMQIGHNYLGYSWDGIMFTSATNLPSAQGTSSYGTDDRWDGVSGHSTNYDIDGHTNPFTWYANPYMPNIEWQYLLQSATHPNNPLTFTQATNILFIDPPGVAGCPIPVIGPAQGMGTISLGNIREMMLGKIVRGQNNYDTLSEEFKLRDSIFAFKQLTIADTLMHLQTDEDEMYQNFFTFCKIRNIGMFEKVNEYTIDKVFGHIDLAKITNQNIPTHGTMQENQKLVNSIYLDKLKFESDTANGIGANYVFNDEEIAQLQGVAYQHPALGGDAVYMARILLWVDVEDDRTLVVKSLAHKPKPQPAKADSFKLYPNPNNGLMTLDYEINGKEISSFAIYDISGRLVKLVILNPENKTITIDATEFNAGAYFYAIKTGVERIKTEKLIIVK